MMVDDAVAAGDVKSTERADCRFAARPPQFFPVGQQRPVDALKQRARSHRHGDDGF